MACILMIERLLRRSVPRNVSSKLPFIEVPGDQHCEPPHLAYVFEHPLTGHFRAYLGFEPLEIENP